eukprot:Ihof_evm8s113 gene=Ihof_evmTU8s113
MTEPTPSAYWHLPWGNDNLGNLIANDHNQHNNQSASNPSNHRDQANRNGQALGGHMGMEHMPMALLLHQPNFLSIPPPHLLANNSYHAPYGLTGLVHPPDWSLPTAPTTYPSQLQQHNHHDGFGGRDHVVRDEGMPADAGYGLGPDPHALLAKRRHNSSPSDNKPLMYLHPDTLLPPAGPAPREIQPAPQHAGMEAPPIANRGSPMVGGFSDVLNHALPSRDAVRRYLDHTQNEQPHPGLVMYYAKIVQKSYGSEKRFFCPPPCVHLVGDRWTDPKRRDDMTLCIEKTQTAVRMMFETAASPIAGLARTLYIADSEKLKAFTLELSVREEGQSLGTFQSGAIKVISKPSQKRQTKANIEMCIESGSKVCLYSRLRAQASHTRYLQADQHNLFISSTQWSSLEVTTANVHGQRQQSDLGQAMPPGPQLVEYGMDITLQNSDFPLVGPRVFTVYSVRGKIVTPVANPREPVASFHKVCLFLKGSGDQYLAIVDDDVNTVAAQRMVDGTCIIPDNAVWTIIAAERMDFPFFESKGPATEPIAPCPMVQAATFKNDGEVELRGTDFHSNLVVWFDDLPADTTF